jgi:hypothetical protein
MHIILLSLENTRDAASVVNYTMTMGELALAYPQTLCLQQ